MDRIRYGGPRFVLIGLYTDHAQCWNVGCRLQLKCDGARWRTWGGRWRGETGVWSGWPSTFHASSKHGVSSITTADAVHLGCQHSTSKWRPPPGRFKWTRSVSHERRNLVSALVPSHFNWPLPSPDLEVRGKTVFNGLHLLPSAFSATGCLFIGPMSTAADTGVFLSYEACLCPECGASLRSAV